MHIPVHVRFICGFFVQEGEKRYNCQECVESYDLCEKCYHAGNWEKHKCEQGAYHDYIVEEYSIITLKDCVSNQSLETCFRNAFQ